MVYVFEECILDWVVLKVVMVVFGGKWWSWKSGCGGFVFFDDVDVYECVWFVIVIGEIFDLCCVDFFLILVLFVDCVVEFVGF